MNPFRRSAGRSEVLKPAPDAAADVKPGAFSREAAIEAGFLTIGEHSYGSPSVIAYPGDSGTITIGRYCSIADGTELFLGGNHRLDWVTTYPLRAVLGLPGALEDGHPSSKGSISIGSDVWVGNDVRILSGVRVGDGAALGAGAVISRDVRPYAVVAGNPAREIRRRFSNPTIAALQRIAWWNWEDDLVRGRVNELCNPDLETFVARYERG